MPIYELRCQECQKSSSHFVRSVTQPFDPICPGCGSKNLTRIVSKFAYHKSMKTIHEESGGPETSYSSPDYYKDPRNIGRWTEKKFQEMGMEMPSQIQEMIQGAREGEMPDSMKDLKSTTPDAAYH